VAAEVCATLFNGGEIEHARAHAITAPFAVADHVHTDLVQFDWLVSCRGSVTVNGRATPLTGPCTFVLIAPRCRHAMMLEPAGVESRVYHARVAVPAAVRRSFHFASSVVAGLPINPSLEAAFNDVWRLTVGGERWPLLRKVKLAEAIALWPGATHGPRDRVAPREPSMGGLDRDLDAALRLMERSLHAPPTLDALADAAHLSTRHFTRRFRDAFGIPPIEFLDRKRLALAQQMLAYESAGVGEVATRMGFSSPAVFSRWFTHRAGETPSAYRARPHQL
jgi:AraC family transcriptional regulator